MTKTRTTHPAAKATELISTQNESWGFFNALRTTPTLEMSEAMAAYAFDACAHAVMAEYRIDADAARRFLDSRYARHVADRMTYHAQGDGSAQATVRRLMAVLAEWAKQTASEIKAAKNGNDVDWYANI